MFALIPLVLFGWIPIVLFLFKHLPPQRALIISFITAYLFLPVYDYLIPGLPSYGKMSATCYAVVIAVLFFDIDRFKSFRFSLVDIPIALWCLCHVASSLNNGLSLYDGFRAASERFAVWGVPYFFGRVYLNSLVGLRALAVGIFAGGLVYAPLCLFEFKMSPQLHRKLYGIDVNSYAFVQSIRKGGYRPYLFNVHGLSVALWMSAVTIIAIWLWQSGAIKRFWNISMGWLVGTLFGLMVLIQSTGALLYVLLSIAVLSTVKWLRTSILVVLLVVVIPFYLYVAATGSFNGDQITQFFSSAVNPDRADSLQFRLNQEKALVVKARERMIVGWAGWGRSRIVDEWGQDASVTDSWWVITFGVNGALGLACGTTVVLLPVLMFVGYYPARTWLHPKVAPSAAISLVLVFYMVDNLVNAMAMPVFVLGIGGLSGLMARHLESDQLGVDGIDLSLAERLVVKQLQLSPAQEEVDRGRSL
ncbi:O-antigen ligase domain-containing protein [Phormidesmis sp. 146-35]